MKYVEFKNHIFRRLRNDFGFKKEGVKFAQFHVHLIRNSLFKNVHAYGITPQLLGVKKEKNLKKA